MNRAAAVRARRLGMPTELGNMPLNTELALASSGGTALGDIPLGTNIYTGAEIDESLGDVAAAIVEKGGSVPAAFADYGDAVRALPSGGGSAAVDATLPVKFVDYDGTLLYSYSIADAAALSELPDPPSHDGLTSQGWNYTLAQMKSQASSMGSCMVGCNYVTTDGATRIRIKVRDPAYSDFRISFTQSVSNGVEVDWGDGTVETFTGPSESVRTHTYSPSEYPTEYTIVLTPNSGTLRFTTNICGYTAQSITSPAGGYCSMVESVKLGAVTSIGAYAFSNCFSLQSISIPSGVTSIGNYAFNYCFSLQSISIPSGVRSIGSSAFGFCYSIRVYDFSNHASVPSLANVNAFANTSTTKKIVVPDSLYDTWKAASNWSSTTNHIVNCIVKASEA
jgi:hypothetical protein